MGESKKQQESEVGAVEQQKKRRIPAGTQEFAQAVITARNRLGLSQMGLSKAAGVSPRTVTQVENEGRARAEIITKLAVACGASPKAWLELAGHKVQKDRI